MLSLYTETAFEVTPATSSSTAEFEIPRKNGSFDQSQSPAKRQARRRTPLLDEQTFVAQNLASESSIYFRQSKSYPRTFSWSVLNSAKTLQIQCSDLARSETDTKEAHFVLRFFFQDPIIHRGVTFADLENGDDLHAFVCTVKNEIFNLQVPPAAFRDPSGLQSKSVQSWCKPLESSSLKLHTAHYLYAATPLEVFISFTNGKLQRLKRRSGDDNWVEDNYDDRSWGASIRGIVSWRGPQAIENGSGHLDPRTAQSMVASTDGIHLFTACLNHTLRVWHLPSGTLVASKDLLDKKRDPNDRTHLNPKEDAHLQVFKLPLQRYPVLLTYSPEDGGQFKFWDIKGSLTDTITLEDKFPGVKLSAPDPDPSGNTVWTMIGFKLEPGNDVQPSRLWVLWRNHNYHQLYNCHFEYANIAASWKSNWVKCATTASQKRLAPEFVRSDHQDPVSKWLNFLLSPGHYSEAVLRTALSIYEDATHKTTITSQADLSLRQRLCTVIAAKVPLRKYGDSDLDFDRFSTDTDTQWRNFHRIVEKVNDTRIAPLSLAYDSFSEMVWIPMSDKICAIRECSKLELLQQNEIEDMADLEDACARIWPHRKVSSDDGDTFTDLATLISAARTFRESFPPELSNNFVSAIEEDISTTPQHVVPTRIVDISDSLGLSEAISDDVFNQLEANLESFGGCTGINNELFLAVIDLLPSKTNTVKSALRTTLFGSFLVSNGIVDQFEAVQQLLLDLLALAVFVEGEFNQEDAKIPSFDASELFDHITPLFKVYQRNLWLARHSRRVPLEFLGTAGHPNPARRQSEIHDQQTRMISIFEDTLGKAVRPQPTVERPQLFLITEQLAEIQSWALGEDSITADDGAVYLQCDMLKQEEFELAADFLLFQPSTSWSSYVKGRLGMGLGQYDMAANYFRKASYGLSHGKAVGNLVELSAGLLSIVEAGSFYNGLPLYLNHITTLFESVKAYNEASQFGHLTLEALQAAQKEPVANFRTEVLSRLFNSELKLTRFREAYNALVQLSDLALQRSYVAALIDTVLGSQISVNGPKSAVRLLQSLPWSMHPHLSRHLDQHLVTLAKKQTTTDMKISDWSSNGSIDYLNIIHGIRVSHKDYRGAVTVLFDRLRLVRRSARARHDPQATALRQVLLALINAMACVAPEEAYILVDADDKMGSKAGKVDDSDTAMTGADGDNDEAAPPRKRRRIIVTLEDLRKEYQQVLDKCSRIERGDFDFDVDGESDEDGDHVTPADQSRLNFSSRNGDSMVF
ncbi:uncharacterized protein A1O9_11163 [Exophiala aquamarina CBS 119918]|uniref:Uncharacterized protein n=1 Tax=Exophiala aquamarina CBS 119918 TaxID=1182545 RepID=A0A072NYV1_9EURO|nr:uncharacterized protein A1O9_11163 [Exophiala aquamarina CBS 119918]KEF52746.1 hypothetical protein A1O9_11163 [Exophiala aquamarina CBS 119918]